MNNNLQKVQNSNRKLTQNFSIQSQQLAVNKFEFDFDLNYFFINFFHRTETQKSVNLNNKNNHWKRN